MKKLLCILLFFFSSVTAFVQFCPDCDMYHSSNTSDCIEPDAYDMYCSVCKEIVFDGEQAGYSPEEIGEHITMLLIAIGTPTAIALLEDLLDTSDDPCIVIKACELCGRDQES